MQIALSYTLTFDDYVEFQKAHKIAKKNFPDAKLPSTFRRIYWWFLVLVIAGSASILMFFDLFSPSAKSSVPSRLLESAIDIGPYLIIFIVIFVIMLSRRGSIYRRSWRGNANLQQPQEITITDESFTIRMTNSRTECLWPYFARSHESANLFLLYGSNHTAHIIPKRAFANPADIDLFRQKILSLNAPPTPAFPVELANEQNPKFY